MDLSAFSNKHFDVYDWVNTTFEAQENESDKQALAASLTLKLELFIQEVNCALEETAQNVIQNLPRVTREVEAMKQEALLLQEQMKTIKQDVIKVERDSAKSMRNLLQIDSIKSRMQEATKALKEADNWFTLSDDVEEVFKKGDVNEIASKLIGMQSSLEILVDVPDYEERCQRLEELKNKLEAILSPNLVASFNTQSMDKTLMYAKIFRDIKRMPQMIKYYHKFQKLQILQLWRKIYEADPEENFSERLNNLYDALLSTWHSQFNFASQIFLDTNPSQILAELFVDVISFLDPSLDFCLEAALKQQNSPIIFLIGLRQITDRFCRSLELAIQSNTATPDSSHLMSLVKTIYSMYGIHLEKYQKYQERELVSRLNNLELISSSTNDTSESVQLLNDSVTKVFSILCEAEAQCTQFTSSCCYPALFRAFETFYSEYSTHFRRVVNKINNTNNKRGKKSLTAMDQDWTSFQSTLHMLQVLGSVLLQIDSLESILLSNIQTVIQNLGYPLSLPLTEEEQRLPVSPFHSYDDVLLTSTTKREFKELIRKYQSGKEVEFLHGARKVIQKMCGEIGKLTFDLVFDNVKSHLQNVPNMKVWMDEVSGATLTSDLPTFSISPQEYITEIGQYLMTLPQHIEPFVLHDNPALFKAMKYGNFPCTSATDEADQVAVFLMGAIARGTLEVYIEKILMIKHLTPYSANQLSTDLGYISDVLEDLGLTLSQTLQDIRDLLKAPPDQFHTVARNKPRNLSQAIQTMRKLRKY